MNEARGRYIFDYAKLAVEEMRRSGIPASITLAQGMLESDNGRSDLAREAKNHFGIKCHTWEGEKFYKDDDEKNECFRKYKLVNESFRDHSDFLMKSARYDFLFRLGVNDYKGWAEGLKKAGYATNPKYPVLLVQIIEEQMLYRFDTVIVDTSWLVAGNTPPQEVKKKKDIRPGDTDKFTLNPYQRKIFSRNNVHYIIAGEGDTFYKISREMDLFLWELYKYNDLEKNAVLKEGELLFIQPKRSKAERNSDYHIVKTGETMRSISQNYAIKLNRLYRKNYMTPGTEPETGAKLSLRKNASTEKNK